MPAEYKIEIEAVTDLDGVPSAVAALSFASPNQLIAVGLSDRNKVLLLEPGSNEVVQEISVSEDVSEIASGGGEYAYAICRRSNSVDVFDCHERVKQIFLPGEPQSISWNGAFKRGKRRIAVTCRVPDERRGLLCVIDEEMFSPPSNTNRVSFK